MSKKFDSIKLLRILSVILMLMIIVVAIYGDKMYQYGEETTTDDIVESYEYEEETVTMQDEHIIEETILSKPKITETMLSKVIDTTRITETVSNGYYVISCSDYEINILAATIYHEAGCDECSDRHQQLVAQVVINRVRNKHFPNSIYDVITQNGQYDNYGRILSLANNSNKIPKRCYDNALLALYGDVDCPDNVVWQSGFVQGEIYEKHMTSYSTTYFCYL